MRGPWVVEGERGDPRVKAATEVDHKRRKKGRVSFENVEGKGQEEEARTTNLSR